MTVTRKKTARSPGARPRGTILLVQGERRARMATSMILRRHDYRVLEASTAGAAAELFAKHGDAIDLLLTDVVMVELNGPGLAQRLVAIQPRLRVLFMSGYESAGRPVGLSSPNVGFLSTPFQEAALLDKVQSALTAQKWTL